MFTPARLAAFAGETGILGAPPACAAGPSARIAPARIVGSAASGHRTLNVALMPPITNPLVCVVTRALGRAVQALVPARSRFDQVRARRPQAEAPAGAGRPDQPEPARASRISAGLSSPDVLS